MEKKIVKLIKNKLFIGGAIIAALHGYQEGTMVIDRIIPRVLNKMRLAKNRIFNMFEPYDYDEEDEYDDEEEEEDDD